MKNIMADKYKTLPIGTIFTYNGNKYKVCEDDTYCRACSECAFKELIVLLLNILEVIVV